MSATSNLVYNLEHRLSHLRGEREAAAAEFHLIEESITRLTALHEKIAGLDKAIEAAETLLVMTVRIGSHHASKRSGPGCGSPRSEVARSEGPR